VNADRPSLELRARLLISDPRDLDDFADVELVASVIG